MLNRIENSTNEKDRDFLKKASVEMNLTSTLLPIKSVGVQGDARSYSHVVCLSSDKEPCNWEEMMKLAKIIPRICHNVNRVCYVFGKAIQYPVIDVTETCLTPNVLATLREADYRAHKVLQDHNCYKAVAQMPVIMIPIHFDRDMIPGSQNNRSYQRSIVIRTFITEDFMTGIPAVPDKHIPFQVKCVLIAMVNYSKFSSGIQRNG